MICGRERLRPRETVLKWHAHAFTRAQTATSKRMSRDQCVHVFDHSQRSVTLQAPRYVVKLRFRSDCIATGQAGRPRASECYTEEAPNAWHRRGTQRTAITYNQPNRPDQHTSQTKHQALSKGQPGRRITPINTAANQHSSCACFSTTTTHHHHPHPTGSSPDPLSQRSPLRSLGAIHRGAVALHQCKLFTFTFT